MKSKIFIFQDAFSHAEMTSSLSGLCLLMTWPACSIPSDLNT